MAKQEVVQDAGDSVADEEGIVDIDEGRESFPEAEPLSYFGTDFDVAGLVRRLSSKEIVVPSFNPAIEVDSELAGFQRRFVWRRYQMDRFIESLLLGYPVPGIFLVQQPDKRMLVLDGQQRLRTLHSFYTGMIDKKRPFILENVSEPLKSLTYGELDPELKRTLDNTFIHATVVKYDPSQDGDVAVYQVFERLNTGGTNLYPHEIRVALYNGKLATLIRDLNQLPNWRTLYGDQSTRLKDQELILRFIALYEDAGRYKRPLKGFLNDFMKRHQNLEGLDGKATMDLFGDVCSAVADGIGKKAFRGKNQVNAALVDSVMCGVAKRLKAGPLPSPVVLGPAFDTLMRNPAFTEAIERATADEDRVSRRLGIATETFLAA